MKFAASVKKVIAFLLCLALLTSDVTVTNATSVDTTDVFAEVSTEMLKETKNAGQEENVSEADSDSNAADLSDTESNVSGQYKQSSDSDGTGDTRKSQEHREHWGDRSNRGDGENGGDRTTGIKNRLRLFQ